MKLPFEFPKGVLQSLAGLFPHHSTSAAQPKETTMTTPAATAAKEETILQKIEDWAAEKWAQAKAFASADIWPIVVDFAHLIVGQVESAEASQAVSLITDLVTGSFSAAAIDVGNTALTTVEADAKTDAIAALDTVTATATATDGTTATATVATTPAANAPDGEAAAEGEAAASDAATLTEASQPATATPPDGSSEADFADSAN